MNIILSNTLTDKQLKDIKYLKTLCTNADNISFGLFTEPELNEYPDMPCFFMIYDDEKAGLLAYLSMFVPGDGTAEISACTHPEYRQKGYFRTLYKKAYEVASEFNIEALIFTNSPTQQTALKILTKYSAVLENTEYLLQYKSPYEHSASSNSTNLSAICIADNITEFSKTYKLTPAMHDELDTHTNIFAAAFGYPYETAKEFIDEILSSGSNVKVFSFTDTATDKIIGCCFAEISASQVMPFGICIHPDAQGQKLGQYMFALLINNYLLRYKKPILLQVSGSNKNALHIYKKSGFKTVSEIDFYRIGMV